MGYELVDIDWLYRRIGAGSAVTAPVTVPAPSRVPELDGGSEPVAPAARRQRCVTASEDLAAHPNALPALRDLATEVGAGLDLIAERNSRSAHVSQP